MHSISRDITLGLNAAIILAILLTSLLYYSFQVSRVEDNLNNKHAERTNDLAGVLAFHLWTFDTAAIQFVGNVQFESADVDGIAITNETGNEILTKGRLKGPGLVVLSKDVIHDKRKVGRLDIAFNTEALTAAKQNILTTAALILLCVVSASFLATRFLLHRYLTRPIHKLRDDVERLAKGDYKETLLTDPRAEISEIIDSFNDLSRKLDQRDRDVREKTESLSKVNNALAQEIEVRKGAEAALQRAHDNLEYRVEVRTAELSETNATLKNEISVREKAELNLKIFSKKLERSNQELQDFAHIASHDLQEPLRKVMVFGDRLKAKYSETLGDQGLDYLQRMQGASSRMQTFINDLLTYSRVTTKAKPFVPVDLGKVVQDAISDLEIRIEESGGRVEIGDLPTIDADPLQMHQLFQNLVGNALKYHKNGQPPIVKIKGSFSGNNERADADTSGEHCLITIEDNGIGFDQQHAERIFEVFQRLHGRSEYEGSGVGLSVCRKITERHGGSISANGAPGHGATFTISLPIRQVHTETTDQV